MAEQLPSDVFEVDANADFLPGAKVLLVTTDEPAALSSSPIVKSTGGGGGIIKWGPGNNHPQQIVKLSNESPEILSLLDFYMTTMYGNGLYYEYIAGSDSKGNPIYKRGFDPEVEDFIAYNQLNSYFLENVMDFCWFANTFPELIKNKRRDKIVQITSQEASFCRFSEQGTKGFSDKVYINANWPSASFDDEETIPVAAVDPYELNQVEYVKALKADKFIFPANFPSPGRVAYQNQIWHSIFDSGWSDIAKLIPILKKALMQFQMTIKYVIEVPQQFWERLAQDRNQNWNELTPAQKKKIKSDLKQEINDYLTGADNAGKSFLTTYGFDVTKGTKIPGVTITALDDKIKDGKYVEDGKEASGHHIRSFGIPIPLIGPISSGDMGAGSGSDARIHMNIYNSRLEPKRFCLLKPLNFIAEFNGWRTRMPGFRWRVERPVLDTLDIAHQTTQLNSAA